MDIQIDPQQLRRLVAETPEKYLLEAIKARAEAREAGRCDYCDKPVRSEPYCSIPYRHEAREPEEWEGICDTPRISPDREAMHYWTDNGTHVTRNRFPGIDFLRRNLRVHIDCDGQGCNYEWCEGGFIGQHLDFDDFKCKWPEEIKTKNLGPLLKTKKQRRAHSKEKGKQWKVAVREAAEKMKKIRASYSE